MNGLYVLRREDRRPFDYASQRHLAATREQMLACECCGKLIAKIAHMSNGMGVGEDCALFLSRPDIWDSAGLRPRRLAELTRAFAGLPRTERP